MKDKVVLITGVSSGIGKAIAQLYADKGAHLVLASRNLDALEKLASALKEKTSEVLIVQTDIANSDDCKKLVSETISIYGRIDLLINNAGISQRSLTMDTNIDVYKTIMDINYFGTIEITKLVLNSMISNGGGQIAVISSVVGKFGFPFRS
ncbi:MAG TPA: SDR family NAD(P)-dependent oxidoreductase, partial [Flavobacteriales bacterium]|nr:SDR family NAD(P)-dependent oxidoreductase [Flavobacteriales bacterium]